jgi:hypothetical protein
MHRLLLLFGLPLCAIAVVAGCSCASKAGNQPPKPGFKLEKTAGFWPRPSKAEAFDVELGSGTLPFASEQQRLTERGKPVILLRLSAQNEFLNEKFVVNDAGIYFVGTDIDQFSPPIPLVEYGNRVGGKWTWHGFNETKGVPPIPATAEISSEEELLRLPSGTYSTVKVAVAISLDSRTGAADEMAFWFSPGSGIVRAKLPGYTRTIRPAK